MSGLGAFYLALSRGTMGLVAPLAALIGAALPAIVAIVAGEELGPVRIVGIVAALVAVVLISLPGGERSAAEQRAVRVDMRDLPLVGLAGLGFAGFYLFLDRAAAEGGETWWPIFVVRLAGVCLVIAAIVVLLVRAGRLPFGQRSAELFRLPRAGVTATSALSLLLLLVLAGAGDLGGNLFFLLANATDALAVSVVLSSLYPVITTVLAAVFLHERLRVVQIGGIALAVLAVVLIGR